MPNRTLPFSSRKVLLLPALVLAMLSAVISLFFTNDIGTVFSTAATILSTIALFIIATADFFKSASEAADMADFRDQVAAMEKRVLRLEDKVSPPADPVRV